MTYLYLIPLLSVLTSPPQAASATELTEWIQAFESLSLAGEGLDASGRSVDLEHLTLGFDSGRLYPVRAGKRPVGWFFTGSGKFRYVSTDPYEAASYRHNVGEETKYKAGDNGALGDRIETALVLTSGDASALVAAESGESAREALASQAEPPGEAAARLAGHVQRWSNDLGWRYTQMLAHALVDPPASPLAIAEISAAAHDLLYKSDPLHDSDVSLAVMRESKSELDWLKDLRYPVQLSVQPLEREWLDARPMPFMLKELDVTLVNPADRDARASVRETIKAVEPVRVLAFWLYDSILGDVGVRAKPEELFWKLSKVEEPGRGPLAFSHSQDTLVVDLGRVLKRGEEVSLAFELEGDILYKPGNDSYWHLGGAWYPRPLSWAMESFTYHAVIKVPEPWTAFSHGRTLRRWKEEETGLACVELSESKPIQMATILAGKYHTISEKSDTLTVRVSSYAMKNEKASRKIAKLVLGFIDFYEPLLGDYPFGELDVIEINALGFGQAPAGIIFITREAFSPGRDEIARQFSEGINSRMAHEVAHAWWGHVAKLSEPEDQWLSEATADYYAAVAMANLKKSEREFKGALQDWKNLTRDAGSRSSVYLANFVVASHGSSHRRELLYGKGPLMLDALRREIDDDNVFFTIFKSYLSSFPMKPARTRDFIGLTSYITKRDFGPWFERYLFGTETPSID